MDERSTSLRSDPTDDSAVYPHSGNGVTQLKNEGRVFADFLLGADSVRNNQQCIHNSQQGSVYSNTITVSEKSFREQDCI